MLTKSFEKWGDVTGNRDLKIANSSLSQLCCHIDNWSQIGEVSIIVNGRRSSIRFVVYIEKRELQVAVVGKRKRFQKGFQSFNAICAKFRGRHGQMLAVYVFQFLQAGEHQSNAPFRYTGIANQENLQQLASTATNGSLEMPHKYSIPLSETSHRATLRDLQDG